MSRVRLSGSLFQSGLPTTMIILPLVLVGCGTQKAIGPGDSSSGGMYGSTGGMSGNEGGIDGGAGAGGGAAARDGGGIGGRDNCEDALPIGLAPGTLVWTRQLSSSGADYVGRLTKSSCGGVEVSGRAGQMTSFGEGSLVSGAFVASVTSADRTRWLRSFSGDVEVSGIGSLPSGIALSGAFSRGVDFGNGTRGGLGGDGFLARYDTGGVLVGFAQYGDRFSDSIEALSTSLDGGILFSVVGAGNVDVGQGPTTLPKLVQIAPDGRVRWIAGKANDFTMIALGGDGAASVVGNRRVAVPTPRMSEPAAFIVSHDPLGAERWNKTFIGSRVSGIVMQPNGETIIVGAAYDAGDPFAPEANFGCGMTPAEATTFVVGLAVDGACQWMRTFAGTHGDTTHVAVDDAGNLVIAAQTSSAEVTDIASGSAVGAGGDLFVARLNSAGTILWGRALGRADQPFAVELFGLALASTGVWMSGSYTSAIDFGGGLLTPEGPTDGFLLKLAP